MGLQCLDPFGLVCSLGFFVPLVSDRRLQLGLGWHKIGIWLSELR